MSCRLAVLCSWRFRNWYKHRFLCAIVNIYAPEENKDTLNLPPPQVLEQAPHVPHDHHIQFTGQQWLLQLLQTRKLVTI